MAVGGVVGAGARVRRSRRWCRRWVPRERVEARLAGGGARPLAWATGLGAASSSCSYAAIAIAKSLFQKGASAVARSHSSSPRTNLVWELGLVLWVLIGWQFTLAEYLGGYRDDPADDRLLRLFVCRRLEERGARSRARRRHRPPAPRGRERARLARAADDRSPPGRTSPTTSAATGRCCGRRSRSDSCSPASSPCSARLLQRLFLNDAPAPAAGDRERGAGARDRRAQLRLLGRQRARWRRCCGRAGSASPA